MSQMNAEQKAAVALPVENCLIIAGAGTGKTKTLISRILHLIQQGLQPSRIVALTFTNKAAMEMKHRLGESLKEAEEVNLGTFHSFALKLIKEDPNGFGYRKIHLLDERSQLNFTKRLFIENQWSEKNGAVQALVDFVNDQKELGRRACQVPYRGKGIKRLISQYEIYEETARDKCYLDFAELMLALKERLADPQYRDTLRSRYDYFLIDEFQDTNPIQYELLNLLTDKVFAVGDDCQSIYAFRGAVVKNLFDFQKKCQHVVKLERNYRSTQTIVKLSNEFISTAKERIEKNLISNKEKGSQVTLFEAYNERDEAQFVVKQINYLLSQNVNPQDIAILYRGNNQSASIETELYQHGLGYKVSGGMSFFEREEIKTVMAAANVLLDRNHIEGLIRLADKLIGSSKLKTLMEKWQIEAEIEKVDFSRLIKQKTSELDELLMAIDEGEKYFNFNNLKNAFHLYLETIGLFDEYSGEKLERIESFLHQIELYEQEGGKSFEEFIDNINNTQNVIGEHRNNVVNLMTIHSSKGLEFEYTFVIGVEDGVIPSTHAIEEHDTEEEKRLFYVAMTRAKKELYLSYCLNRFNGFEFVQYPRSRFIEELNPKYIHALNCSIGKDKETATSKKALCEEHKSLHDLFLEKTQQQAVEANRKGKLREKDSTSQLNQINQANDNTQSEVRAEGMGGNECNENNQTSSSQYVCVEGEIPTNNELNKNVRKTSTFSDKKTLKTLKPCDIMIGGTYSFNGEKGKVISIKQSEYSDFLSEVETQNGNKILALELVMIAEC